MPHIEPKDPSAFLPLTHLSIQVLLALADRDLHGYGIIKEVEQRTDGVIRPATGTLYTALQRLMDDGLIELTGEASPDDARRRAYRLTRLGRRVAAAEVERLAGVVRTAQGKRVVKG
jgi:DNA-binding PadR family transcriptional regulator